MDFHSTLSNKIVMISCKMCVSGVYLVELFIKHKTLNLEVEYCKRNIRNPTMNTKYYYLLLTLHKRYTFASELVPHVLLLPYHQEPKGRCNDPLGAHFI